MTDSITTFRDTLRKEALQRRNDLAEHLHFAFSHLIRNKVLELASESEVSVVHCYLSFRSEVETLSLVRAMESCSIQVIAPVVIQEGDVLKMEHYELSKILTSGLYGVPEPERNIRTDINSIEMVIVPIVAYDGTGTRLGYGKGFYDRFLAQIDPSVKRIGLAFSVQEVDEIPRLAHDQQLDMIVTETGIVHTERY